MSNLELSTDVWFIKLTPYHFQFFKDLAKEHGDTERGAEARQCRIFLNKTIRVHKDKKAI